MIKRKCIKRISEDIRGYQRNKKAPQKEKWLRYCEQKRALGMSLSIDYAVFFESFLSQKRDIKRERARIGGDWAIATVISSRSLRDLVRYFLFNESPCQVLENRPDQVLALFGSKMLIFANSYVSYRQELGPELEIAVVEMTLEQQVATNYSPRSHSFRKTSFHHPPTFKCDIIFSMCCRWSGLGRGTKATSRPSIC